MTRHPSSERIPGPDVVGATGGSGTRVVAVAAQSSPDPRGAVRDRDGAKAMPRPRMMTDGRIRAAGTSSSGLASVSTA